MCQFYTVNILIILNVCFVEVGFGGSKVLFITAPGLESVPSEWPKALSSQIW